MRKSLVGAWVGLVGLLIACGGGGTTNRRDYGQPDVPPDSSGADGHEVISDLDGGVGPDISDRADAGVSDETPAAKDDGISPAQDDGGVDETSVDVVPDSTEVETVQPECPCDETVEFWVCGVDGKDYKNDQCAKCAICKDDPFTCVGCTGEKACNPKDPLGPDGWIKQKDKCEVCICDDAAECERLILQFPCGPFCDEQQQTWQTPCEMKKAYGCNPDFDENIETYGPCKAPPCEGCEGQPENPVCGSDGETYPNYCTLATCPKQAGVTLSYPGHCLNAQFCSQCASLPKAAVCGSDGVTYANECAATTCLGKGVAYAGPCCVECKPDGPGVCGADLKTYPNDCVLLCLGVQKLYDGPCTCPCDLSGPEVCGSDGKTHPNQCWLDCLQLKKLFDGPCPECPTCPRTFDPACGGDNKTYPNECWLQCQGAVLKNPGVCSTCQAICGTPDNPVGGPNPACGPDGITYPTACFATKCVGYSEGQVSPGPCP